MIQRAELLDLVLRDLYGERRLLRTGIVPPEMILSDPQFLRACDGIRIPGDKQLVVFGTDLARSRRRSLADARAPDPGTRPGPPTPSRTAACCRGCSRSSSARRACSDWPRSSRPCVRRCRPPSPTASTIRRSWSSRPARCRRPPSSTPRSPPSSAIRWSRDPTSSCGDGQVWLRTVGGWVPVHVILRRVDAGFCDPLELRSDSTLGVPGLVDACRAGTGERRQHARFGRARERRAGAVSCPTLARAPARQRPDPGLGAVVVVRRRRRPLPRAGQPRTLVVRPLLALDARALDRHESLASAAELDELRRRIEADPTSGSARSGSSPRPRRCCRATGSSPGHRAADVRRRRGRRLRRHAGRPGPHRDRRRRRPITNRIGAVSKDTWVLERRTRTGSRVLAGRVRSAGRRPERCAPGPGRREPVLARPLRRAGRGDRPPAAHDQRPARRVPDTRRPGPGPPSLDRAARGADPDHRHVSRVRRRRRRVAASTTRATSCSRSSSTSSDRAPSPTRSATCSTRSTSSATSCRSTPGSSSDRCSASSTGWSSRPTTRRHRPRRGRHDRAQRVAAGAAGAVGSGHRVDGARPRLAVHGGRPADRAGAADHRAGRIDARHRTQRPGREPHRRVGADRRREHHHLPSALPVAGRRLATAHRPAARPTAATPDRCASSSTGSPTTVALLRADRPRRVDARRHCR